MSRSSVVVLLLACFILSVIVGVVQAAGCTPDPNTQMCIASDKTTYSPGQYIIVTVEVSGRASSTATSETYPIAALLSSPNCSAFSAGVGCTATALGSITVTVEPGILGTFSGTGTFKLPSNMTAGYYLLMVFYYKSGDYHTGADTAITITAPTPVTETPSSCDIYATRFSPYQMCIGTDKATYISGEIISFDVESIGFPVCSSSSSTSTSPICNYDVIVQAVPPQCPNCVVASGIVTTFENTTSPNSESGQGADIASNIWEGNSTLTIPPNTPPGLYAVEVFPINTNANVMLASTQITITSASVAETPSVLGLLLPALLVGIYVMKSKNQHTHDFDGTEFSTVMTPLRVPQEMDSILTT
jgi:hypothetical protein